MAGRFNKAFTVICVLLLSFGGAVAASADDGDAPFLSNKVAVFTGIDVTEDSWFVYAGGLLTLEGLGENSPAIKAVIGGGDFEYVSPFNAFGNLPRQIIQGDNFTFDLLAGYRVYVGQFLIGGYAGLNYWDIDHENILSAGNPPTPPGALAFGDRYGLKVEGELTYVGPTPLFLDVRGSYSTAFDTYWALGRIGYKTGMFTFGPEGTALGNLDYDQLRIGAFVMFNLFDSGLFLTLSGGYAETDGTTAGDGVYGTGNLVATF